MDNSTRDNLLASGTHHTPLAVEAALPAPPRLDVGEFKEAAVAAIRDTCDVCRLDAGRVLVECHNWDDGQLAAIVGAPWTEWVRWLNRQWRNLGGA